MKKPEKHNTKSRKYKGIRNQRKTNTKNFPQKELRYKIGTRKLPVT